MARSEEIETAVFVGQTCLMYNIVHEQRTEQGGWSDDVSSCRIRNKSRTPRDMMIIFMWVEVWSVLVIFYKYEKCPKPVTLRIITQFERFTVRGFLADAYATLPWEPETFHARFPVSVKWKLLVKREKKSLFPRVMQRISAI